MPGSQVLSSINTTHWGLKVGSSYHDLKMRGLFQTKPDVVFAATFAERDEREISKTIFIGRTHFKNEEIKHFGKSRTCLLPIEQAVYEYGTNIGPAKHRLEHAPWYQFWFDNCQGFAVNDLARHILCLRCSNDAPDLSRNAELIAMLELATLRPFEIGNVISIVLAPSDRLVLQSYPGCDWFSGDVLLFYPPASMHMLAIFARPLSHGSNADRKGR